VSASCVVEIDDPGCDLDSGFGAGGEVLAVDLFDLEGGVECFGGGVVQSLSGRSKIGSAFGPG
jgi:hypothetical protein